MDIQLRLNNHDALEKLFKIYLNKYPKSTYLGRINYLNTIHLAKLEVYLETLKSCNNGLKVEISSETESLLKKNGAQLVENYVYPYSLQDTELILVPFLGSIANIIIKKDKRKE